MCFFRFSVAKQTLIKDGDWETEEDAQYTEKTVFISGFSVFHLEEKRNAAPGVDGTGDGTAEQSPPDNTNSIDIRGEEVKP